MNRLVCLLAGSTLCLSAQWPQFRGPGGSGVGDKAPLPVRFTKADAAWRTELPPGHSSPVVFGDRIFLTAAQLGQRKDAGLQKIVDEGGRLFTICLDRRTGRILWQREAPRPRLERYQPANSPASPTPATDGKSVFVFFGDFGLLAYSVDGEEKWRMPLGPFNNVNGHGSSPVLVDDLVVLLCDQDVGSFLVAADKDTGRVRWRAERPEFTRCYATPGVFRPRNGPAELIVPGAHQLTGYEARSGKKLWWIGGLSWQPKSTPVIEGDTIYAHWWENGGEAEAPAATPTYEETLARFDKDGDRRVSLAEAAADARFEKGFPNNDLGGDGYLDERDWNAYRARRASLNALLAVRHGARGDLTGSPSIRWRMQKYLPNAPSPLLYQGVLYLVKDGGILTAVDPETGGMFKQGRLTGALDTYYSSPVAGGGHVYVTSQKGKMTVLKAGKEWEMASQTDFEEDCYATPAMVDGALYVRTAVALYCFRVK